MFLGRPEVGELWALLRGRGMRSGRAERKVEVGREAFGEELRKNGELELEMLAAATQTGN